MKFNFRAPLNILLMLFSLKISPCLKVITYHINIEGGNATLKTKNSIVQPQKMYSFYHQTFNPSTLL